MNSTVTSFNNDGAQGRRGGRTRPATSARYFSRVAAIIMLTMMVAGSHPYYLRGEGMAGRITSPKLATLASTTANGMSRV